MKAELKHKLELITTPKELMKLAEKWQEQIESNDYEEGSSTYSQVIDDIELKLKLNSSQFHFETGKMILKKLL